MVGISASKSEQEDSFTYGDSEVNSIVDLDVDFEDEMTILDSQSTEEKTT